MLLLLSSHDDGDHYYSYSYPYCYYCYYQEAVVMPLRHTARSDFHVING